MYTHNRMSIFIQVSSYIDYNNWDNSKEIKWRNKIARLTFLRLRKDCQTEVYRWLRVSYLTVYSGSLDSEEIRCSKNPSV